MLRVRAFSAPTYPSLKVIGTAMMAVINTIPAMVPSPKINR